MLQRADAYSWWWASHIRTKQSKWLDSNLREMEDTVRNMLKLVDADADSFAKRAELYFKRRPELISYVEDAYRAYRALAERYDRVSGELHKANHTIATACPEQVQYAMLEEEDDDPRSITPVDPSRINKRTVEGIIKKRRVSESSLRKIQHKKSTSQIDQEKMQEEINKLQKEILVLQTEKGFIKSSYEGGIVKYWEIVRQIMEKQEKVCCLQDESPSTAAIGDDEARALMTETALKSCEDAIASLQQQRKESLEQAKVEYERIQIAKKKLQALKGEFGQSMMDNAETSSEHKQMSFTAESMEKEADSLNKARLELQSLCEKIKEHLQMNPESSAVEIAEKINELVIKVTTLELTVSSQAAQINRITSESDEFEQNLLNLEEEKVTLIKDSDELTKRLKEAEEELSRVEAIEKLVQEEEINFHENFTEAFQSLNGISEKVQPPKPLEDEPLENDCNGDASLGEDVSTCSTEDKEVSEIHCIKGDLVEEIDASQPLGNFLDDFFQNEAVSELNSGSEKIKDPKESNELGEKEPSLHEVEMMALIGELKNVIAMKDEEMKLLRQQLASQKMSSNGSVHAPPFEDSAMVTEVSDPQDSHMPKDLNVESTVKRDSCVKSTEIAKGKNVQRINETKNIPPVEEKFKKDVNHLLGKSLQFWLKFSTSFQHIQQLKAKYEDLQTDIDKLKDNSQDGNDTASGDQAGKPESTLMATRLKEFKTELQKWSEQSELLRGELQKRCLSLGNMQEEISSVVNTNSKSGEAMFTSYKAARLQGEVMSMKQENKKAASELQVGLDHVKKLQADIEKLLSKLYEKFKPFVSDESGSSVGVPLRVFLYGSKRPKKPSIFARIRPMFQKHRSKLKAGRRSKSSIS